MIAPARTRFTELSARERAAALLDPGTFRELIGPFERLESPHLEPQGIVPACDDGVVVARGELDGKESVVLAVEGLFQGGGIGEVSGAKIAGALELALRDAESGRPVCPVILLETGGIRLQEANLGLLAIAEIHAAIVALRSYVPVVGVIGGMVGCFGGMAIAAGLCSHVVMTREGRLGLNGPQVLEQELRRPPPGMGDHRRRTTRCHRYGGFARRGRCCSDRPGGAVRVRSRSIHGAPQRTGWRLRSPAGRYRRVRAARWTGAAHLVERRWERAMSGGRTWFEALAGATSGGEPSSVLCADGAVDGERARFLAVVPDPEPKFPRARGGELGLEEGWAIARYVREAVAEDGDRRALVAIVDVPGQPYGYREELLGLHLALAAAVDAYATARLAGHPVVALVVGQAISGAFLAHGMQANRIIALEDPGVTVQVMSKRSTARITRRSVEELDQIAEEVPATAYDVASFARLGALHRLIQGVNAAEPTEEDVERVRGALAEEISSARHDGSTDLSGRLDSPEARQHRGASLRVRERLAEEWSG